MYKQDLPSAEDISAVGLEDGGGRLVKIRFAHIRDVFSHFQTVVHLHENVHADGETWLNGDQVSVASEFLSEVLAPLIDKLDELSDPFETLRDAKKGDPLSKWKKFVDFSTTRKTLATHAAITPYNPLMFIYSLIMIYGKFVTELDFTQQASLKHALVASRTLTDLSLKQCDDLAAKYYGEHLRWESAASARKCRLFKKCREVLRELVLNNAISYGDLPPILMQQIRAEYSVKANRFLDEQHQRLVKCLAESSGIQSFPPVEALIKKEPVNWNPLHHLVNPGIDNLDYLPEQRSVVLAGVSKIRRIAAVNDRSYITGVLIIGAPGTGKSYLAYNLVTYALTCGLNAVTTTLTALRASQLGGIWIHSLFCMRPGMSISNDPNIDAMICRNALVRNPEKVALLQTMHVLMIDEIGLLSLQQLTVIDLVLREVRQCKRTFGGVLVIATGDYCQLQPINGQLVWQSLTLFTSFDLFSLRHLVRSMHDKNLQEVINLSRKSQLSPSELNIVANIIRADAKFVESFNDAPEAFIKVVSKKEARDKLTKDCMQARQQKMDAENADRTERRQPLLKMATFDAQDEYETRPGEWSQAPNKISRLLTQAVREVSKLLVCEGDTMRITRNDSSSANFQYSNGQTCRILDITFDEDGKPKSVEVELARPGTTHFPENVTRVELRKSAGQPVQVGRQMVIARRKQLPVVWHEIMTIHAAIGQTRDGLITCMSKNKNSVYYVWSREQFIVLISRVHYLNTVYFVGETPGMEEENIREQTLEAVRYILGPNRAPPHWAGIERWIEVTNMIAPEPVVNMQDFLPLHTFQQALPLDDVPCVYMYVSKRYFMQYHIGHCSDLTLQLRSDNSPIPLVGPEVVGGNEIEHRAVWRPFYVACYIIGRDRHLSERERYQIRQLLRERCRVAASSSVAFQVIEDWVREFNAENDEGRQITLVKLCHPAVLN